MNKILSTFKFVTTRIIVAAMVAVVLMVLTYSIPTEKIKDNVIQSATTFEIEGTYPVLSSSFTSQLDNWTDSIILLESSYEGEYSVLEKALINYRYDIKGMTPTETLVEMYLYENQDFEDYPYSRYWHGYLCVVKPLLYFFNYDSIRVLNAVFQNVVLLIVSFLLIKNKLSSYIIPYLLCYGLLVPSVLIRSIQLSNCFYLFSFSIMLILLLNLYEKCTEEVFLYIGIATAFFDFLTYPLSTFGIPVIVFLSLKMDNKNLKSNIISLIKTGILWGIGYLAMWASKWVLGSLLTGDNTLLNAFNQILLRVSHVDKTGEVYSIRYSVVSNIYQFIKNPIIILTILFVGGLFLTVCAKMLKQKHLFVQGVKIAVPYLCIAILPILWFSVTVNHSSVHVWFTNKTLIVSTFAVTCMLLKVYSVFIEDRKNHSD